MDNGAATGLAPAQQRGQAELIDAVFVAELRQQMVKFATLQLRDRHQAEDAVQEALLGAINNGATFQQRSAFKSWVFGILKNKIIDILRQQRRTIAISQLGDDDDSSLDLLFDKHGHWDVSQRPVAWGSPTQASHNAQFWRVFECCLENLPESQARLFMLREMFELTSAEICATLDISVSNLHVQLYRARLRLRECLENRWFVEVKK